MKYLIAAALLCLAGAANATYCADGSLIASHPNGDCSKTNTPTPPKPSKTSAKSNSDSASNSNSTSSADQKQKQKQKQKQQQQQESTSSADGTNETNVDTSDHSSSSFRALAVSLPSPVFVPPNAVSTGCPFVNQEGHAWAGGWNFVSKSDNFSNTDNCFGLELADRWRALCQYQTADRTLFGLTQKLLPGIPEEVKYTPNLTKDECDKLKLPMLPMPDNTKPPENLLQSIKWECPALEKPTVFKPRGHKKLKVDCGK